jgi:Bacterial Ig domain/Bacterial Ig-like domain
MTRKLIPFLALVVLLGAAFAAAPASALPCNPDTDPDCDPGGGQTITTVQVDLDVAPPTSGTVTGAQISCGADCHGDYSYVRTCEDFDCTLSSVDDVVLDASGGPSGFSPHFTYCPANAAGDACTDATIDCGIGACTISMDDDYRATLEWVDTTAPGQASLTGPGTVGPSVKTFTASATDNLQVTAMRFVLDGVSQPTLDTSAPFQFDAPVNSLAEGVHTLVAFARDAAGNEGTASGTVNFTVDKHTTVTITSPAAGGHFQTPPEFMFDTEDGATAVCSTLTGATGDTSVHSAACNSGAYTPQPTGDGVYRVRVVATDAVGNVAPSERQFTLDDSDPNVTVNSPAENGRLKSPFTPDVTATDGQAGALAVTCQYGAGAPAPCGAKSLADGAATLTVTVTDLAGNSRTVVRHFTVDSSGPAVSFTAGPADGSIVRATSVTFRWTATDGSQPVTQRCKLDGAALAACSGIGSHVMNGLSAGSHTFTLEVTDALGNVTRIERDFFVTLETTPLTTTTTQPPAEREIVNATLSSDYDAFRRFTKYNVLTVKGVPEGATVTVKCKGKKCPRKSFKTTRKGNVKLSKFAKKKLRAGVTLTIRVTKPGAIGKQFVIKIRAGKRPTLKISQLA